MMAYTGIITEMYVDCHKGILICYQVTSYKYCHVHLRDNTMIYKSKGQSFIT